MKFGKNIGKVVELSDPEWSPFWINYKFLKKKAKVCGCVGGSLSQEAGKDSVVCFFCFFVVGLLERSTLLRGPFAVETRTPTPRWREVRPFAHNYSCIQTQRAVSCPSHSRVEYRPRSKFKMSWENSQWRNEDSLPILQQRAGNLDGGGSGSRPPGTAFDRQQPSSNVATPQGFVLMTKGCRFLVTHSDA